MKSRNKIGVDILLIPSDEMMDNASEVNQALDIWADNIQRAGLFR